MVVMSKADSKNWRAANPISDATAETPNAHSIEVPMNWKGMSMVSPSTPTMDSSTPRSGSRSSSG